MVITDRRRAAMSDFFAVPILNFRRPTEMNLAESLVGKMSKDDFL
ncbi:hypothetical protein [Rhizobium sp. Pop5]|nr:hypothetical protein [Rhizobium sp. Pop5]